MEELANAGTRAALSGEWQAQAQALDPAATEDPFALARIGSAYVDYLKRCRAEGLSYRAAWPVPRRHDAARAAVLSAQSRARGARRGRMARCWRSATRLTASWSGASTARYSAAAPAGRAGRSLDRAATGAGIVRRSRARDPHAGRGLRGTAPPTGQVLPVGRLDRLSLVATKADHITAGQLNNLVGLLRDMLGEPFMQRECPPIRPAGDRVGPSDDAGVMRSIRARRCLPARRSGRTVARAAAATRSKCGRARSRAQIPTARNWNIASSSTSGSSRRRGWGPFRTSGHLPHINLDKVLQSLIA